MLRALFKILERVAKQMVYVALRVGIFHETFIVERGNYEATYGNMPVFELAKATEHVRAIG